MSLDHRADDREPQPEPAERAAEPAERLGQGGGVVRLDDRTAVGDEDPRAVAIGRGDDRQPAVRLVVPDPVVDQVGDHPLEQRRLAARPRRPQIGPHRDLGLLRARAQIGDAVGRERREVDRLLLASGRSLAARQHEQSLDQPLAAVDRVTHRLAHRAQLADAGIWIGERDVDLGPHDRQRRS